MTPPPAVAAAKAALRAPAETRRTALHRAAGATVSHALATRFQAKWVARSGCVISGFLPFRSEPDLQPLLCELDSAGWITGLPIVEAAGLPLRFRRWKPGAALETGCFGIPVPTADAADIEPDWLLIPLLAYDKAGYRLGYGGGFYDATLADLRRRKSVFALGVAFDGQEVDHVPHGPSDARLDAILTEKRVITVET